MFSQASKNQAAAPKIDVVSLLKKQRKGDANLYDHLSNVFAKILLDHPQNAYESFEEISHEVKKHKYNFADPKTYDNTNLIREKFSEVKSHVTQSRKLLGLVRMPSFGPKFLFEIFLEAEKPRGPSS
jgi:Radial spokehead-like protein